MREAPPSLVFAVVGQARLSGGLSPEAESRILTSMLTYWALRSTLGEAVLRPVPAARRVTAPALQPSVN
jgi:hypothetical protein